MNQIIFPNQLNVDFRETARGIGAMVRFPAGATLFREGDPADHMYILLNGSIDMKRKDKVIELIGPGDALGIVAIIDGKPRSATAVAVTDVELALIDRKNFRFMVETVPHFVWYVIAELVDRLRATNAALG